MEMMMWVWLFNPGDKVCDIFKINGEHRFFFLLFSLFLSSALALAPRFGSRAITAAPTIGT
jgi:hypothetical protein